MTKPFGAEGKNCRESDKTASVIPSKNAEGLKEAGSASEVCTKQRDNMITWLQDNKSTVTYAPTTTSRQPMRRLLAYGRFGSQTSINSQKG